MSKEKKEIQWLKLTLSSPAVLAKYLPGNQQCRSALQLRISCAGVLHCRSVPTYFKLLYLLTHPDIPAQVDWA